MAYATLYQNNTFSILDNRKFIKPNSVIYELPPKDNLYIPDETLADKIKYSYCKPPSLTQGKDEVYNYQYDDMFTGNRDVANKEVLRKDKVEEEKDKKENYENLQGHSCSDGVKILSWILVLI